MLEKGEAKNYLEEKNREKLNLTEKNKNDLIKQMDEKMKDLNSEKNQKDTIIDSSVRDFSMNDNDEFDDLFNDDDKRGSNFESNAIITNQKNIAQDNQSINIINNKDQNNKNNQIVELKPKNSMKIKLNFDLNTVELNSKFVEINQDTQMNEYADEDEPNYFDEFEEEKNEENYENEDDNQGENMEIDDNYYDGFDEENDNNCFVREKSTIITIPNLNFLSEQNFDDTDKPRMEHVGISSDKIRNENACNIDKASKITNGGENLKGANSNCKFKFLVRVLFYFIQIFE